MPDTVFKHVQILNGPGADAHAGEVLVHGNRIKEVARDGDFHKRPTADLKAHRQAV